MHTEMEVIDRNDRTKSHQNQYYHLILSDVLCIALQKYVMYYWSEMILKFGPSQSSLAYTESYVAYIISHKIIATHISINEAVL